MKFLTRRAVLFIWSTFSFFWVALFLIAKACSNNYPNWEDKIICSIPDYLSVFPEPLLIFVLSVTIMLSPVVLTTRNYTFTAWSRFAIFGIPLVLLFTWWNLNQSTGFMGLGAGVLLGQLLVVYGIYFLISLIVIARAWREGK